LPFVVVGGLLITMRLRRFHLVGSFLLAYLGLLTIMLLIWLSPAKTLDLVANALVYSPLPFLAMVMVVEPLTSPTSRKLRVAYGIAIGLVLTLLQRGPLPNTFELALLAGNLMARAVRFDPRLTLALVGKERLSSEIMGFWFEPSRPLHYRPGQFLEWTLAHPRPDRGGVRRHFTIASSPTEAHLLVATKIGAQPSSFKAAMRALKPGEDVSARGLEGEFTLPSDTTRPCVFIAAGIGITPFRSMVTYMLHHKERRPITLVYSTRAAGDLVFRDTFDRATHELGLKPVYVLSGEAPAGWQGRTGRVDAAMIREEVPDYAERLFYLSGPEPMVLALEKMLSDMGIRRGNIKRDYFPGYKATGEA